MSFADFLKESTGVAVEDTMKVLKAEFDENRIQSTKMRDDKLEVESHYDGEIYHVNVSPLTVKLTERNEVIESYSLVFKTAKEIADKIIDKLQSFSKWLKGPRGPFNLSAEFNHIISV